MAFLNPLEQSTQIKQLMQIKRAKKNLHNEMAKDFHIRVEAIKLVKSASRKF
jgi:hypothetical protein